MGGAECLDDMRYEDMQAISGCRNDIPFSLTETIMRQSIKRRVFRSETLEPRRVLDSTVVFNELMYHSVDDDPANEWIELHNQAYIAGDGRKLNHRWRLCEARASGSGGVEVFGGARIVDGRFSTLCWRHEHSG